MTAIGLLGENGRMGRAIAAAAAERGVTVAGALGRDADAAERAALARTADVLIDFTTPDALADHLDAAVAAGTPIMVGTTGLGPDHHAALDAAARAVPVLQAANTSLGVAVLRALVTRAAGMLGPDWDVEIVEMHHRHKLDAPSGTALLLGQAAAAGRGRGHDEIARVDRMTAGAAAREAGTIHYASLRGGSVAGDHQVILAGEGERIEIGHRAESRAIFATGALRAALWLADGRAAGRYAMEDVLGL